MEGEGVSRGKDALLKTSNPSSRLQINSGPKNCEQQHQPFKEVSLSNAAQWVILIMLQ